MSSMRNAVQRRNHKERAQPKEREKWGVLEKHKDYSLRAADYNAKKARLKILRQKAAERNPDEFYFGMYRSKTHDKGQKLADRGNQSLSHDAVKLLKTQDAGYLKIMAQQTRRARERLEKAFVLKGENAVKVRGLEDGALDGSKIIYADNKAEQMLLDTRPHVQESALNEDETMSDVEQAQEAVSAMDLSTIQHKSRRQLEAEENAIKQARIIRKRRKRDEETQGSRLKALRSRERDLLAAERELELQRAKMSNSVGGVNKAGIKWKVRERKR